MVLEYSAEWQNWLVDPYAVIGVPVTADGQRLMKRYRSVAKLLHPDRYIQADPALRELVTQLLTRLVNPAYGKVKDEVSQKEILVLIRLQAQQAAKDGIDLQTAVARSLKSQPVEAVDSFYEQQVSAFSDRQYTDLNFFSEATRSLVELNAVYFQLKHSEPTWRPRRTGLMPMPSMPQSNSSQSTHHSTQHSGQQSSQHSGQTIVPPDQTSNHLYARRHYDRAKHYAQNSGWKEAITELKDAIRMDTSCSDYHALLGFIYFKQEQRGMARVHFKQALKLNPEDNLAKRFLPYVTDDRSAATPDAKGTEKRKLFGFFGR
jgi:curved DNA-binding protein CbpA